MEKNFCLCCDDKYVPFAAVTIKSILRNVQDEDDVKIHVITMGLEEQNVTFLTELSDGVYVHTISESECMSNFKTTREWSLAAWLRVFIVDIVGEDVDKVLYLDCDVIVNDGLDELFSRDMSGKSIAACIDIQTYSTEPFDRLGMSRSMDYVCSGVLMINVSYWRAHDIKYRIIDYGTSANVKFPDQDAINFVCQDSKIVLEPEYGVLVPFFLNNDFIRDYRNKLEGLWKSPKIIHYAGYSPWVYCKNRSVHSDIWWRYYRELHAFPHVRLEYHKGKLKWWARLLMTKLGIFRKGHRLSTNGEYFNHQRVTENSVMQLINGLNE